MKSLLIIVMAFLFSSNLWAKNSFLESLNKKAEVKKKTRWTLSDWLGTKQQVGIMDSWLAANYSANLFEFYAGGSVSKVEDTVTSTPLSLPIEGDISHYTLAGFVTIFGLKLEQDKEEDVTRSSVEVILRLLGRSEQSTRLNAFYGGYSVDDDVFNKKYNLQYYGGELRLYLLSFLALEGRYQKFQEAEMPNMVKQNGDQVEYGVALDIGPIQLFGKYITSTFNYSNDVDVKRDGLRYGAYLYF